MSSNVLQPYTSHKYPSFYISLFLCHSYIPLHILPIYCGFFGFSYSSFQERENTGYPEPPFSFSLYNYCLYIYIYVCALLSLDVSIIDSDLNSRVEYEVLNMKRAPVNLFPQSHAVDVEARAKLKYQTLLQEYLELQKESVSKKRKLQATNQKRETLFGEIRFLRRRRRYLLKIRSSKVEVEKNVQPQESDMERKMLERGRNYSVNETALRNPYPVLVSIPNSRDEEGGGRRVVTEPLRVEKKHKNSLIDDKRLGKKEISWQDQVPLRV